MCEDMLIEYRFGSERTDGSIFRLRFDPEDFSLRRDPAQPLPPWVALDFCQCPNCVLPVGPHAHCPLAVSIADVVDRFDGIVSHDEIDLEVVTSERHIIQRTTAQRAVSSLMGLLMATSGCPHTAVFRPMARFHLPLATEEETTYRVLSMYLLARYLGSEGAGSQPLTIDGLPEIYDRVHRVNVAMAKRLRAATSTDSSVNALIMLDVFAIDIPFSIDESLAKIRALFSGFTAD